MLTAGPYLQIRVMECEWYKDVFLTTGGCGEIWLYRKKVNLSWSHTLFAVVVVGLITASDHIGPYRGHRTASEFHSTASDHRCDRDTQKRPWKYRIVGLGNSLVWVHHLRSVAYSAELVLLISI